MSAVMEGAVPSLLAVNDMSLLDAALTYARRGWKVFPVAHNSRLPKSGCYWKRESTTNEYVIRGWWGAGENSNIGLACGKDSDLLVIDIDTKNGQEGGKSYTAIEQQPFLGPGQRTPSLGAHLLFKFEDGYSNFTRKGRFGGIDCRTDGGYIVVAPSVADGRRYLWTQDGPVTAIPPKFREAMKQWSTESTTLTLDMPDVVGTPTDYNTLGLKPEYLRYLNSGDASQWRDPNGRPDESAAVFAVAGALMRKIQDPSQVYSILVSNQFAYACAQRHRTRGRPEEWLWKYGIAKIVEAATKVDCVDIFKPLSDTPPSVREFLADARPVEEVEDDFFVNADVGLTKHLKPVNWLVKGMIPQASVGILYGPSGSFKTFAALDMALCICLGVQWHDRKTYAKGSVIYVAGEGQAGIWKRVEAWRQHYNRANKTNITKQDIANSGFFVSSHSLDLMNPETLKPVNDLIHRRGEAPKIIVFDTLRQNFTGNENDSADVSAVLKACQQMVTAYGSTVMLLHHTTKGDGSMRGSGALTNNADFIISAQNAEGGGRIVELQPLKSKDSQLGGSEFFEMQQTVVEGVFDCDGLLDTSLVPVRISKSGAQLTIKEQVVLSKIQRAVLGVVREEVNRLGFTGDLAKVHSKSIALSYRIANPGSKSNHVNRALTALVRLGFLDMHDEGDAIWYSNRGADSGDKDDGDE